MMKKFFLLPIAALMVLATFSCEKDPEPVDPDPGNKEEEVTPVETPETPIVSKGAYKHVVIVGVDGAGAFFKDTPTPRCDEIFAGQATTYRSKTSFPTISLSWS